MHLRFNFNSWYGSKKKACTKKQVKDHANLKRNKPQRSEERSGAGEQTAFLCKQLARNQTRAAHQLLQTVDDGLQLCKELGLVLVIKHIELAHVAQRVLSLQSRKNNFVFAHRVCLVDALNEEEATREPLQLQIKGTCRLLWILADCLQGSCLHTAPYYRQYMQRSDRLRDQSAWQAVENDPTA